VAVLAASSVRATLMRPLSVAELAGHADLVLRGRVAAVEVRWDRSGRIPITFVQLEVLEVLEGQLPPFRTVTLAQPGGEADGVALDYAGRPRFEPGEETVVFLSRRGTNRFIPVGLAQGKFRLGSPDGNGRRPLSRDLAGIALVEWGDGQHPAAPATLGELRRQLAARARSLAGGER
jgi:hypothetical protein